MDCGLSQKGARHATVGNIGGGGSSDVADGGVRAGLHVWRLGEGPWVFAGGCDARARCGAYGFCESTASMVSVNSTGLPHRRRQLYLNGNQISSIESGDFSGLTNLTEL